MQEPVQINLSNDPDDARYTVLVTRLVDVINGCDTGIALSCLLSLYRACLLGKPSFHAGGKHYLQQILDELKALDGDKAPAATPVPAGAPAGRRRPPGGGPGPRRRRAEPSRSRQKWPTRPRASRH